MWFANQQHLVCKHYRLLPKKCYKQQQQQQHDLAVHILPHKKTGPPGEETPGKGPELRTSCKPKIIKWKRRSCNLSIDWYTEYRGFGFAVSNRSCRMFFHGKSCKERGAPATWPNNCKLKLHSTRQKCLGGCLPQWNKQSFLLWPFHIGHSSTKVCFSTTCNI